jgi:hypothetical protein
MVWAETSKRRASSSTISRPRGPGNIEDSGLAVRESGHGAPSNGAPKVAAACGRGVNETDQHFGTAATIKS